jgi:hypothetical protein
MNAINTIPQLKRFILRALLRLKGIPWPDALLDDTLRRGLVPSPLLSDVHQAKHELERCGFIQGVQDDLDDQVSWTLTARGRHRAKELE